MDKQTGPGAWAENESDWLYSSTNASLSLGKFWTRTFLASSSQMMGQESAKHRIETSRPKLA